MNHFSDCLQHEFELSTSSILKTRENRFYFELMYALSLYCFVISENGIIIVIFFFIKKFKN